jgi:CheY-like chemotaxis protein
VRLTAELEPDLVLMDLNLPGIDGLEATRQILAAREPRPAVIALSTDSGLAIKALASGAVAFVAKEEFDPDSLADAWESART